MKRWIQLFLFVGLFLFLATSAFAQGSFFSGIAWRYTPAGAFPASGASITVCTSSATGQPCTPTISLFADVALSMPVANPLPTCTVSPQFGCIDGLGNFSFYASTTGPYVYTATGAGLAPYGPIPILASLNPTANITFTGQILCKNWENIRCATQFPGSDWVAKVNAADADLGATPGEIWMDTSAGLNASTALSLGTSHTLRFIQGGAYVTSKAITLGIASGIAGPPSGVAPNNTSAPFIIQQASGANLAVFVTLNQQAFLRDLTIDGNQGLNAGTICVQAIGIRTQLKDMTVANCNSHGIQVGSTGTNVAAGAILNDVMSIDNGGSGLFLFHIFDPVISQSQFENNSRFGIEATDGGSVRINNSDIGGNTLGGISANCPDDGANANSIQWTITGNQFANNTGADIVATGAAGSYCLFGWTIVGNTFGGLSTTASDNTIDSIHLDSGGKHTVVGNYFFSTAAHRYRYDISSASTNNTEQTDIIGLNEFHGSIGTAAANLLATAWLGFNDNYGTPGHLNFLSLDSTAGGGAIQHLAPNTAGNFTLTDPAVNGTQSVGTQCGTMAANAACSNTITTLEHVISGIAILNTGTSTFTGISPAFTSATSYFCVGNDLTTPANSVSVVPASASTVTVTGTTTDHIQFVCVGG